MRFSTFERRAHEEFEAVPEEFRQGIGGPVVERKARRHAWLPGYYTLGMCVPVPAAFTMGEEHLSTVFLYYGSFVACAMRDPEFVVEEELRETILHEIRHHIEDRAGSPSLRNEDAAEEQDERRRRGLEFHPAYYRAGTREGDSLWSLHEDLFLEIAPDRRALARALREGLPVRWHGREIAVPAEAFRRLPSFTEFPGEGKAHGHRRGDLVVVVVER